MHFGHDDAVIARYFPELHGAQDASTDAVPGVGSCPLGHDGTLCGAQEIAPGAAVVALYLPGAQAEQTMDSFAALLICCPLEHVLSVHAVASVALEYFPEPHAAQAVSTVAVPGVVPCPAGHDGVLCGPHGAAPCVLGSNVPGAQAVHVVLPAASAYFPDSHGAQVAVKSEVWPAFPNLPATQAVPVQLAWPASSENIPGAQTGQPPPTWAYRPGTHAVAHTCGSSAALLRYWPASHVFSAHTEPSAATEYLPAPQGAQVTSVVAVPSVAPCPAGHDGALCGTHGAPPPLVSEYCDPTHASHFASSASAEPGLRPEPAAHDVTVWAAHAQSEQPARLGCAAYRPGAQLAQDASSRTEDPSTYTVPAAHPLTDLSSQRERRGSPGEGQALYFPAAQAAQPVPPPDALAVPAGQSVQYAGSPAVVNVPAGHGSGTAEGSAPAVSSQH